MSIGSSQIYSVSRWLDNSDLTPILETGQGNPSGPYSILLVTSSSDVYIGGTGIAVGSDFPSGGISVEGGYYGYPLVANKEYSLVVYHNGEDTPLYATTTSSEGAVISILACPAIR